MSQPRIVREQFEAWVAFCEEGVPYFEASRKAGTTMRRLRDWENDGGVERGTVAETIEISRERQAAKVETLIETRSEDSDQVLLARAKANHPDYADKQRVEISGPDGGPIGIEGRVTGLADVVAFAIRSGNADVLGLSLDAGLLSKALPAAPDVLPDARDGERPAGVLPPARPA